MKMNGRVGTRLLVLYAIWLVFMLVLTPVANAQLSVEHTGDTRILPLPYGGAAAGTGGAAGAMSGLTSSVPEMLPPARGIGSAGAGLAVKTMLSRSYYAPAAPAKKFDFTQTAPHLAFFCRLEINEAAGNIIPARFRLGGHRYWQDNLLRQ